MEWSYKIQIQLQIVRGSCPATSCLTQETMTDDTVMVEYHKKGIIWQSETKETKHGGAIQLNGVLLISSDEKGQYWSLQTTGTQRWKARTRTDMVSENQVYGMLGDVSCESRTHNYPSVEQLINHHIPCPAWMPCSSWVWGALEPANCSLSCSKCEGESCGSVSVCVSRESCEEDSLK